MTRKASGKNHPITNLQRFLSGVVVAYDEDSDENEGGADDSSGGEGEESDDGESEGGDDSSGGGSGDNIKDPDKKKLSDEAAANRVRAKKAEDALAEANKRLKEIDDADKSELDKATALTTEQAETIESLQASNRNMALELAFFQSGAAGMFKNPNNARKLMELDALEVGDDGKVDAAKVKEMAQALLKTDPYMAADGSEGGSDDTGGSPNNGRRKKGDQASKEILQKKYPALASRQG